MLEEVCGMDAQDVENIRYPEGMKLIGARKCGKGLCLYFSEIWGENSDRTLVAKGYRICLRDFMGRMGEFHKGEITFHGAAYGVQCFYMECEMA